MTNSNEQITKPAEITPERVDRANRRPVFAPPVDIIETPREVLLRADLPGADEKNVDITLEKGVVTLRAKSVAQEPGGFRLIDREFVPGDFERAFALSEEIDQEGIEASVRNGVLELRLPKAKAVRTRKIDITTG